MRRLLTIIALGLALPLLVVFGLGAKGDGGGGYRVRAIFDNASATVPGEDVKVAGAKVGVIQSMDVTKDKKASLVLRIEDARFAPFHADATCTIRPQSLIGEKFVECNPGRSGAPDLARIDHGDGKGQHFLPLARTSSPIDLDLIGNINRLPYRQRLSILLNELGTGLAGRGKDLNEVIHRANPALAQTDKVLAILARQNHVLGRLAVDSDRALAPLARDREKLTGFIRSAGDTATATAQRRQDISRGIQRLPRFLGELKPLMVDLRGFSGQATPVATALNSSGADVSRVIEKLGPFSSAATPSFTSLGAALRTGRPAVLRTRPLIQDLGGFAKDGRPLSTNLDRLTASLDKTGGIESLMDLVFNNGLALNGYDSTGHYERANLLNNLCSTYRTSPQEGCSARFGGLGSSSAVRQSAATAKTTAADARDAPGEPSVLSGILGDGQSALGRANIERIRRSRGQTGVVGSAPDEPALDYLLGSN